MTFVNSRPEAIVPVNVSGSSALDAPQDAPQIDYTGVMAAFRGFAVSGASEMPSLTANAGALLMLHMGGTPLAMAIPILPYDQALPGAKDPQRGKGKAPAHPKAGKWYPLENWQRGGIGHDVMVASEVAGCNGGVILGAPCYPTNAGEDGWQLYFIDIDLEDGPNALTYREILVRGIRRVTGNQDLAVRNTIPHRAGILVALTADAASGFKKVFHLQHEGAGIGKLEVLGHGQQAVFSGRHHSGNRITWQHDLMPGWKFPAPPLKLGVPRFATFGDLLDALKAMLFQMEDCGFTYSETGSGGKFAPVPVAENAAPSVSALCELLDKMENPPKLDRDTYVAISIAAGGAREGIIAVNGQLSQSESDLVKNAFVDWVLRWTPPKRMSPPDREAEANKWDSDWGRPREGKGSGWRQLKALAAEHCKVPADYLRDLANEEAAEQFAGHSGPAQEMPQQPGENPQEAADRLHPTAIGAMVRRFNEKYAIVGDAGKVMIWEEKRDEFLNRSYHIRYDFRSFTNLHLKTFVEVHDPKTGKTERSPAAPLWLGHQDGRIYQDGAVFDPSGKDYGPTVLHLWKGFAVKPRKGSWAKLQDHVTNVVCSGNEEHAKYALDWIANMFQNPATVGEVAMVMRGPEGCGKGILAQAIIRIFGQHGMAVNNSDQMLGKFNLHLRDLVFLFPDEAFFAGNKEHADKLKYLVTSPTLPIEGKGLNIVTVPNFLHIMMASNSEWVIPAAMDSRRYFVLDVPGTRVGDKAYFDAIVAELEDGGYEAFLHDMLHRDLSGFNHRQAPVTDALIEQRKRSLDTTNAWWLDVLYRGYVFESRLGLAEYFAEWHADISGSLLETSYATFAKSRNERHPLNREALGNFIKKMGGKPIRPTTMVTGEHMTDGSPLPTEAKERGPNGERPADPRFVSANRRIADLVHKNRERGYHLGDLDTARKAFLKATKLKIDWPEDADPAP
jgi:hypothetical protein